jgi:hypothetical protein
LNLEVEIKDGGRNPNTHPKIMAVDNEKEKLKDAVMCSNSSTFSYLKITDEENVKFLRFLDKVKENVANGITSNIVML